MSNISVLRPWRPEDGAWYVAQLSDPMIQEFTVESVDTTAADFCAALAGASADPDGLARAIVYSATGKLAGNLAAARDGEVVEIHFWLAAPARGTGLAQRAVSEALDWVMAHWPAVRTAVVRIKSGNTASERVARRLGFHSAPDRDTTTAVRDETWHMNGYTKTLR